MQQNGIISWGPLPTGTTCRVEWASSLSGIWRTNWDELASLVTTNEQMSAEVPMFYRVVASLDLSRDLVAHWTFSGDANDLTTNANNGVITSATFVNDRHTNAASALDFQTADTYVTVVNSPSLDIHGGISISLWAKARSLPSSGARMLLGKSDYVTGTDYILRVLPGGRLQWEYGYYFETVTSPIDTDSWHHILVCATAPLGIARIYIDGVLVTHTQRPGGNHASVTNPLTIGCAGYWSAPWSEHFDGAIDDVRIYNRALTPAEVTAIYNQEK